MCKVCFNHMKKYNTCLQSAEPTYILPRHPIKPTLYPRAIFYGYQIVYWDPVNAKLSCPKNKLVWAMWKCMVSMATRYMILNNVGRPTKSIVTMVLLIIEHLTWS